MKKQVTWIWTMLCILLLAACEKPVLENYDGVKPTGKSKSKSTRIVRIHPTELVVETMETPMDAKGQPLSRADKVDKKRLYAVNVYEKKPGEEKYQMYAYGLFTLQSKISIKMNEKNLYKVECLIVEENPGRLYMGKDGYDVPFLHGTKELTKASNSFVYSKEENLREIKKGDTKIEDGRIVHYPRLVKLYGSIDDFSPKAKTDLTLDMKRTVFGLHFKVAPPEEGTLVINYVGWRISLGKDSPIYDDASPYSFNNIENACQPDHQATLEVKIAWTKDDGTSEKVTKKLVVKRNIMTVVDIKVEGPKGRGILFKEESGEMKTENVDWHISM